jgi:hypothetical protein
VKSGLAVARLLPSKTYDMLLWISAIAILRVALLGVQHCQEHSQAGYRAS